MTRKDHLAHSSRTCLGAVRRSRAAAVLAMTFSKFALVLGAQTDLRRRVAASLSAWLRFIRGKKPASCSSVGDEVWVVMLSQRTYSSLALSYDCGHVGRQFQPTINGFLTQ